MNRALKFGAMLIGTYLVVHYATGSGQVIRETASGTRNVIRAFQGR